MSKFTLMTNADTLMIWYKPIDGYVTLLYIVDCHNSTMVDGYGSDWRLP